MSLVLFRGLYNDGPTIKVNCCALGVPGHGELGSVFHFDHRAVAKTNESMRVFGRANMLAALYLLARGHQRASSIGDLIDLAFSRLHRSFKLSAKRRVTPYERKRQQTKTDYQGGSNSPSHNDRLNMIAPVRDGFSYRRNRARAGCLHGLPARDALMGVIDQQK